MWAVTHQTQRGTATTHGYNDYWACPPGHKNECHPASSPATGVGVSCVPPHGVLEGLLGCHMRGHEHLYMPAVFHSCEIRHYCPVWTAGMARCDAVKVMACELPSVELSSLLDCQKPFLQPCWAMVSRAIAGQAMWIHDLAKVGQEPLAVQLYG